MTCKDCFHHNACRGVTNYRTFDFLIGGQWADSCEFFTQMSEWLHLPCKPGSTVYWVWDMPDQQKCAECQYFYEGGMGDYPRCERTKDGRRYATCLEIIPFEGIDLEFILCHYTDFGKELFISREEAGKVLAERQNAERSSNESSISL